MRPATSSPARRSGSSSSTVHTTQGYCDRLVASLLGETRTAVSGATGVVVDHFALSSFMSASVTPTFAATRAHCAQPSQRPSFASEKFDVATVAAICRRWAKPRSLPGISGMPAASAICTVSRMASR